MKGPIPLPLLALGAILMLAGCGSSSGSVESTSTGKAKPELAVPKGPPPKRLVVNDIQEGTGAAVKMGDEVTIKWIGILYKNGREFGSSWHDRNTFTFRTGTGRVIPGWDRGMIGMKVGGRRKLTIPPWLAYQDGETLIYVVDLLALKAGSRRSA
jgi:peptidylprolyl isomerase